MKQCFRDSKINNLDDIFFIGKVENLNDDYFALCKILNVVGKPLGYERKTFDRKQNYREYYTDKTRKIIEKMYEKDFQMFNYKF